MSWSHLHILGGFYTLNLPWKNRTEKKNVLHNKTYGKISFQYLDIYIYICTVEGIITIEEDHLPLTNKKIQEKYYREK